MALSSISTAVLRCGCYRSQSVVNALPVMAGIVTPSHVDKTLPVTTGRCNMRRFHADCSGGRWNITSQNAIFSLFTVVASKQASENTRNIISHKVDVNGVHLNYATTGHGKNVVLLLPGALGCGETDFQLQLENINKDLFTLVAWDPQGYGRSIPPKRNWPAHFYQRDADDAAKLLQNLDITNCTLAGYSDGGVTAILLAAKYPELVRKMVIWGANAYVDDDHIASSDKARNIKDWSERKRKSFFSVYDKEYLQTQFSSWVDAIGKYKTEREGDICQRELSQVKCPTLVLHGEKDLTLLPHHPIYVQKHIKCSRLHVIPDGKHNVHQSHYREFNSLLENFVIMP